MFTSNNGQFDCHQQTIDPRPVLARSGVDTIGSPGPTGRVPFDTATRLFNRVRSDLTDVEYDTFRVQREHDDDPHRVVRCPAKLEGKAKNSRSTGTLIYDAGTQP